MSRGRKRRDPPFWVTGPSGGKSTSGKPLPFVPVYVDLLQAPAFLNLTPSARFCFISMAAEAKGSPAFEFPKSIAARYGIPSTTLRRCISELIHAGFICCASSGRFTRSANSYQFSLAWKQTPPP